MIEVRAHFDGNKKVFSCKDNGKSVGEATLELCGNRIFVQIKFVSEPNREILTRTALSSAAATGLCVVSSEPDFVKYGFVRDGDWYILSSDALFFPCECAKK